MRLVTQEYDTGDKYRYKTMKGFLPVERLEGQSVFCGQVNALVTAECWNTKASMRKLIENLEWTIERLKIEITNNERDGMRLVTYEYDTGHRFRFKTTKNALDITERFEGKCIRNGRMEIFIDTMCRDENAMKTLMEHLEWTIDRLKVEIKNNETALVTLA